MSTPRQEVLDTVDRAIAACRRGDWKGGYEQLSEVARDTASEGELPAVFYSYLGYGLVRFEGRKREGLQLCRQAAKVDFYRGETYLDLAYAYLHVENRAAAVKAVDQGLAVDPRNKRLRRLKRELGLRRRPVLRFLDRSHPLNVLLGRIRHLLSGGSSRS